MKRSKKSWLLVAVCISALALLVAGCSHSSAPPANQGNPPAPPEVKDFRVGMECNYAPFNWTQLDDSNGAVPIDGGNFANGYDVQIAKKIADGLGRNLVIVKTEWDGLILALNAGMIDAVIAGMSPTADRALSVDFSEPYYNSDLVIVVRNDSPFAAAKSIQDFKGAKITAQLNTFHYTVIDQIEGVKMQQAMTDFPAMIVALGSGIIDGYISERPGANSAVRSNAALTFVAFDEGQGFAASLEDTAISVALKKGNSDLAKIDEIVATISKDERETLMEEALANQPAEE